jgi:hypothetical protein
VNMCDVALVEGARALSEDVTPIGHLGGNDARDA